MKKLISLLLTLTFAVSVCGISAFASVKARNVAINPSTRTIQNGETLKLRASVSPERADYDDVVWSSSDTSIISVDSDGKITGEDVGKATIYCEVYGRDDNGNSIKLVSTRAAFEVVSKHEANRVTIFAGSDTVRVGRTLQLSETVYPSNVKYYEVEWSTDDYTIVELDEYGEITGLAPGEATIMCRIYGDDENYKKSWLGSANITITVVESVTGGSSSSSSGKVSASTVNGAVKKALVRGKTTSATFKDAESVSAMTLQAAALTMTNGGGTVLLNFDTMNGKSIEGRLTINPAEAAKVKGDIKTEIYTNDGAVSKTRTTFQKYFKNDVVVIKAAHSGSYGMNVTGAVKIGTSLAKSKDLRLYSYDPDRNKYQEISGSNIRIDASGYVHFNTYIGDYLVVTNGKLAKR